MGTIVFVDGTAPHEYTQNTFSSPECRLGATEASTVRIAEALAKNHTVYLLQYHRKAREEGGGIHFRGITDVEGIKADIVVFLRLPQGLPVIRSQWPEARVFLWLHDLHGKEMTLAYPAILKARAEIICVSQFHAERIRNLLAAAPEYKQEIPIHAIYLPLADSLPKPAISYDRNQLVFASTPAKGLKQVVECFIRARLEMPDLKLVIFNPGYREAHLPHIPHVVYRGRQPNDEVVRTIGNSLCLFIPQTAIPETFGMVFAESHAVGTPVLAHRFGAAVELLGDSELIDGYNRIDVVEHLHSWYSGKRPNVCINKELCLTSILEKWTNLFCGKWPAEMVEIRKHDA